MWVERGGACPVLSEWEEHRYMTVVGANICGPVLEQPSFPQDRTGLPRAIWKVELHLKTGRNKTEKKFSHENVCQCVSSKDRDWMPWATRTISFLSPCTNTLIGEWGGCIKLKDYNACRVMTIWPVFKFFFCVTYSFLPGREYVK